MKRKPSSLTRDDFVSLYGGVYEHSPHFALAVWPRAKTGALDSLAGLAGALKAAVESAGHEAQLVLVRAHPDLAGRVKLSPESAGEQSGAGLDHCSPAELEEFLALNAAYRVKFGFPFIKAVRGFSRPQILEEFRARLNHDPDTEFAAALEQIHRIALLRLTDLAETT